MIDNPSPSPDLDPNSLRPPTDPNGIDAIVQHGEEVAQSMVHGSLTPEDPPLSLLDQARIVTQKDHIADQKVLYEKHLEARVDGLTGLLNRRGFLENMTGNLEKAHNGDIGLLYLDLDNFKKLNDMRGHRAGDVLLRDFAKWLSEKIRESAPDADDFLCRLGGDEFVIGLDIKTRIVNNRELRANQVLDSVGAQLTEGFAAEFLDEHPALERLHLGVTWGGAINERGTKLAELLDMADREMYDRKYEKKRRGGINQQGGS